MASYEMLTPQPCKKCGKVTMEYPLCLMCSMKEAMAELARLGQEWDGVPIKCSLGYKCPEGPHGACCGEPDEEGERCDEQRQAQ